ncbi:hypothetical protein I6G56_25970 [Burkholderia humptydooensis]|uniref:Uncharacterized protein n=2 Tax=Burkholderia humptydooensis TaxID=430531 RepID=A0A7T2U8Z7_9BURK|nr:MULTISPECIES: hypothetical protein [Burkholderia]EIP84655.1 hypothetical protein A33K_18668 [Burkholderia humptydooensis MSMB43]QPS47823.1 hypothetical protein I6G56_25970 [Burkholderia humptydooensis]
MQRPRAPGRAGRFGRTAGRDPTGKRWPNAQDAHDDAGDRPWPLSSLDVEPASSQAGDVSGRIDGASGGRRLVLQARRPSSDLYRCSR